MKPLILYHASCADGFGAAFAAWTVLGDDAEYAPCKYNDLAIGQLGAEFKQHRLIDGDGKLYPVDDREVYILDFSLHKSLMDILFRVAKRVVWLDHHKTAFEMWAAKGYLDKYSSFTNLSEPHHILLNDNKSGAVLAWEYFHPNEEIPMLIRHIDDYDRWQFKIEGTKAFNKALWSYAPWSFEQWSYMFLNNPYPIDLRRMYAEGEAILRAHDQNVQAVVKGSARECGINWVPVGETGMYDPDFEKGLAANCPPHLTSDVGHELATQSGTFGLCWTFGQSGTVAKCSLRSNGEYDVSAIAKSFGGGGHRNAAGFEVDIQVLLGWLK